MSPRTVATFSVTAGVLLILGACSPLDDADLFGSKTLNVNFDGGVVVYENGKKVSCLATDKYGGCEKGTLEFCKNGYLYEASCASKPKCGWSAALNHYACGTAGGYQPIDGGGSAHDSYVQSCGKLPTQGCCDGGMLKFCKSSQQSFDDCTAKGKQCGWDGAKYACGTNTKSDPSKKYPRDCSNYITKQDAAPVVGDGGTGPGPQKCGKLPPEGCCGGNMLDFCQSGKKQSQDCAGNPKCGWDAAKKKYGCGTSGGKDPAGKFPINCKAYLSSSDGGSTGPDSSNPSGDGGGPGPGCGKLPAQGCCGGNQLDYCAGGAKLNKDCTGSPKCGWDPTKKKYACGTSGGKDPSGQYPKDCKSYLQAGDGGPGDGPGPPPGDGGKPPPLKDGGGGPGPGCGKLPPEGCCQGHMLDYCQNSKKASMSCQSKPSCGWSASAKKYTCGTSGGKDPSGKFPKSCAAYLAPVDGGTKKDGPKIPDGPPPPKDGPKPPPKDGPKPPDGPVKPPQDGLPPPKDGPKPPTDGPKPPTDGPKPPVDGPKPPTDGPKPPVDGPKPPTDGPKPPVDGPKPPKDGPKPPVDGPVTKDNLPPKEGTGPKADASASGTEGGPCYGNGTCNPGLKCYSKVCVKVPTTEGGAQKDAGGGIVDEETGCECSTSSVSSPPTWPLLLLGLILVRLRRRK